jgi:hypothetical protein
MNSNLKPRSEIKAGYPPLIYTFTGKYIADSGSARISLRNKIKKLRYYPVYKNAEGWILIDRTQPFKSKPEV